MNKKNRVLSEELAEYIDAHTSELPPYMDELVRETYLHVLMPHMISGKVQGVALKMLSSLLRPKKILEIGTFTGYSSICLAQGLQSDGQLFTIDVNEELEEIIEKFVTKAGLSDKITFLTGDALEIIPKLDHVFDFVFIDADKRSYADYYQLVLPKLSDDGAILVDNVLWDGKVADIENCNDKKTKIMRKFNKMVQDDPNVENTILPIRDGMMMIRKKKS
ncbi:MAG: methyltransferase [Thalassobius sp.]|nr:methyltransferase [Thalassovita sp.]